VPYFSCGVHLARTIKPCALNKYPEPLYKILFDTVWETLSAFGTNPRHLGAKLALIAVLHTGARTYNTSTPALHRSQRRCLKSWVLGKRERK